MIITKIKGFFEDIDYFIVIPTLLLCGIGLLCIYSATLGTDEPHFTKQAVNFSIGLALLLFVVLIPIRLLDGGAVTLYIATLSMLILVLFVGTVRYGARRWFTLGPIGFQPSEIAKIAMILCTARVLALRRVNASQLGNIIITFSLAIIPMILIIKEPDLGTSLCVGSVALPMLYWHGITLFSIFVMFSPLATVLIHIGSGYNFTALMFTFFVEWVILYFSKRKTPVILAVLAVNIICGLASEPIWGSLKEYQKQRVLNFIDPERDVKGSGYQVTQSKIAIGSGGLWGKGYLEGTQTQLKFLPEQHTDFIFSVVGEEFGFFGSLVLLSIFAVLIFRMVIIANIVDDKFAGLTLIGIASLFSFQLLVNIGMTAGLMPVTGIPLPLMSYGGTAMWINLVLIGIVVNISMRKKRYEIH